MKKLKHILTILLVTVFLVTPMPAQADFWGGDIPLLMEIVQNTLQQLYQLKSILGTGQDTLQYLHDINAGIMEAMDIMRTLNTTLHPGVLSDIHGPQDLFRMVQNIYGIIPQTSDQKLEQLTDQSVAEAIDLHNHAFEYADQIDPQAELIKDYSHKVSQVGATKLTAESLGVLIHVTNQVLRTNAAMLKLLGEDLALKNRREKANSAQFRMQYDSISDGISNLKSMKDSTNLKN